MLYIYAEIDRIDYKLLLSKLRQKGDGKDKWWATPWKLEKALNWKWLRNKIREKIPNFAKDYGLSLSTIRIENNPIDIESIKKSKQMVKQLFEKTLTVMQMPITNNKVNHIVGGDSMFNISATISNIDYNKLANSINKPTKSNSGKNNVVIETIKIVEPFINDTMRTIPPSAIVQLVNLFVRDKIYDMARDYGVDIKDISIKSS